MKILRVTSLGYEGGGTENGIVLVNEELRKRGHDVRVLASDARSDLPHFNDYTFPAFSKASGWLKPLYGCFYPASFFALRRVLKEYQPDVVHLHTMSEVSPSVLFLLRRYPTVLTIHGAEDFTRGLLVWAFPLHMFRGGVVDAGHLTVLGWLHYLYHRYVNGIVYRLLFRNVDMFVVFSRYMQELLKHEGIASRFVPNATRLFPRTPLPAGAHQTIAYVGRLEKIKGVQDAIVAMGEVCAKHPNARLEIAGTGNYQRELAHTVEHLGLQERVRFLGHCTRDELQVLYERATVLVLPSIWPEPFGKVGIEAMSVGRPVVASDVGGVREWLRDGEQGFLVPPQDPHTLAQRVSTLLDDPELLATMARKARDQALQYSIEEHTARMLALYRKVR